MGVLQVLVRAWGTGEGVRDRWGCDRSLKVLDIQEQGTGA